ncbi:MAG: RnfABCDGE type electron transport complex subunit A [Candidatus Izemoplasmatales bacterium]|jgi:electron transport complex protein RnfA|nr:RnfABCDGE type electron transport complex subunit A [Candidatus Izemoplasmatales bacterium]MDD3865031.1 RnfABCDGE type electron transport complex subunit A [Candidatus Izemoplasmatales bacterium]
MAELIAIAFAAFFVENVLLTQFLGICSFIGVGKKRSSSLGMGLAVVVVIILSSVVTWLIYNFVMVPLEIEFMKTIVFILVIAALVQMIEIIIKRFSPSLYKALGIYLPLITTNCAVLGVALTNVKEGYNFSQMIVYATAIPLGYLFVMYIYAIIREKMEFSPIPKAFQGIPIAMVLAAILALIFSRFGGLA